MEVNRNSSFKDSSHRFCGDMFYDFSITQLLADVLTVLIFATYPLGCSMAISGKKMKGSLESKVLSLFRIL